MKEQNASITLSEISESAEKRVALISQEFKAGFEFVKNYPKSVTFFGSARTKTGDKYYEKARELAKMIVEKLHYSIVTGGGPGIMEAANRGAYEAGGNSIGLTIELPHEQVTNPYITSHMGFHYFFSRKVCLSFSAEAYIFFPGGFGTLDEFLEIMTLVQTKKIPAAPIILFGESYWQPLDKFFKGFLRDKGMIDELDTSLYLISDDEAEILKLIEKAPVRFGIKYNDSSEKYLEENGRNATGPLSQLSEKHCVPCEGGMPPLSKTESEVLLKEVDEWTLMGEKEILKTYKFEDFKEAMQFVINVGKIAEKENHHPDIKIFDYKKVEIRISTHAIDGLSENDFILASKIDDLLRDK